MRNSCPRTSTYSIFPKSRAILFSPNDSDQRLVRCIAWFWGASSVFENQRKATDCGYGWGDDKSEERVAKVREPQRIAAGAVGAAAEERSLRANGFRNQAGSSVSRSSGNGRNDGGGAVCEITDEQVATERLLGGILAAINLVYWPGNPAPIPDNEATDSA
jgi:hypothetical protein